MSTAVTSIRRLCLRIIGRSGIGRAVQPMFGGMGAVLMFHHVGHRAPRFFGGNDHLTIKPEFLTQLLDEFRQECIDIVSVDEALWRMRSAQSTQPFVAFTFDDGYRDNIETAYPILQKFRVPFTLFVCSGFVDREVPIWWLSLERIIQSNNHISLKVGDQVHELDCDGKRRKCNAFGKAIRLLSEAGQDQLLASIGDLCERTDHDALRLVDQEMSTWSMLQALSKDPLVTIGSHTHSHPFLPTLSEDDVRLEMTKGRDRITEMIGKAPKYFAYPYGFEKAVGSREVAIAEEIGIEAAFTTRKGLLSSKHADHICALPRVSINGHYQYMSAMRALLSGLPFYFANGFKRVKVL